MAAEAKKLKRRRNFTEPELCRWMKEKEETRGVNGKTAGSFLIWFPRHPVTGVLLDPPENAITFDWDKNGWITNPWDIGFKSLDCEIHGDSIVLGPKLIEYMEKINHPQANEAHRVIVQWKGYYGPDQNRTFNLPVPLGRGR